MNVYHYYLEQWKENVYLLCPATPELVRDFCLDQFGVVYEPDATLYGEALSISPQIGDDRTHCQVIALCQFDLSPDILAMLAHECFHATEFIMKKIDIPHSPDTSEVFAYTLGMIMRLCLRDLMEPGEPSDGDVIRENVTEMKRC